MRIDRTLNTNLTNIAYAVVIASFIIIWITTGMTSQNGLTALISGYSGLLAALVFLVVLGWTNMDQTVPIMTRLTSFIPFIVLIFIISLLVAYLSIYFERISTDQMSTYYYTFSHMSTLFLAVQIGILFRSILTTSSMDPKTFSILMLLGTINAIIVISLGVILKFYSTQG
jgi:hypothetical protein